MNLEKSVNLGFQKVHSSLIPTIRKVIKLAQKSSTKYPERKDIYIRKKEGELKCKKHKHIQEQEKYMNKNF